MNTKKLNEFLSNLMVMNVKLHDLHWNVRCHNFKAVHEYLESLYDMMFEQYDAVAEHLKMHGEAPFVTLRDYIEHATIKENEKHCFTREDAFEIVHKDFTALRKAAAEIRNEADEKGEFGTVNIFEDFCLGYDKVLWFCEASEECKVEKTRLDCIDS